MRNGECSDNKDIDTALFFEYTPVLHCVANIHGHFIKVNRLFVDTFGYSTKELCNTPFVELVHPDDRKSTIEEINKHATGATTLNFENRYKCKDGTYVWLRWFARPRDDLIFATAIRIDVEKDRLAQTARTARRMQQLYRLSADPKLSNANRVIAVLKYGCAELRADLGIVGEMKDSVYTVRDVSTELLAIAPGQTFELSKTFCDITLKADNVVAIQHVGESEYRTHPAYAATKYEAYIGAPLSVSGRRHGTVNFVSMAPRREAYTEDDKHFVWLMGIWISRSVEQENEREQLEQYKQAVVHASDHIVLTDNKGVILYANEAVSHTTGYTAEEMLGKTPALWGRQMEKTFYKHMWSTLTVEKKVFVGELTNKRKDGTLYEAEVHIAPILGRDGELVYCVGIERDISKQKQLERAKTQFISLASHNLKTPLSSVRWFSEMLLQGDAGKLNENQLDFAKEIHKASVSMTDLIISLLNISRIELGTYTFEPKDVAIEEVVKRVIGELHDRIIQNNLVLDMYYEDCLPCVRTDTAMLAQVIHNLLTNAIKYNTRGKKLYTKLFRKDAHKEVYGKYFEQDTVVLVVGDEGLGIPTNEQEHVFHQFFRASNVQTVETDGTGLGLYLIHIIVEQMNGYIWFSSTEGKGSEFYVALPIIGTIYE